MSDIYTTRLSVCPIRDKPKDASEMISQLLFGECVEVIKKGKTPWVYVRCEYDGYEGWMDSKQLIRLDNKYRSVSYCVDKVQPAANSEVNALLTLGAVLPQFDGMTFKIGDRAYQYSGHAIDGNANVERPLMIEKLAMMLLGAPYLWGGRSPLGIDCSGLVQIIYKCVGVPLPRDSSDQSKIGHLVRIISEASVGDLAYFSKSSANVSHVGIVLGDNKIIHASGEVRIDTLDGYGIFNEEMDKYTHRLLVVRRVL